MNLRDITPVILTFNEAPNIGRTLDRLRWARGVVVVDSLSTDRTAEIARGFPNVRLLTRPFDSHESQWNFATGKTGIATEWLLTLDADYILSDAAASEFEALRPDESTGGYIAQFRFCVWGRPLSRSILPGRIVLFRRARGSFYQDGHTQRVRVEGKILPLSQTISHDDRKPLSHWIASQDRYAELERDKILAARGELGLPDRIRAGKFWAPVIVLFYCLVVKRLMFAGLAGWHYTYQRVMAEILLSLYLIESSLTDRDANRK